MCRRLEPLGQLSVPLRCVGALVWWRPTPPPHRLTHGYAGRPLRPTDLGQSGHSAAASNLAGRADYRSDVPLWSGGRGQRRSDRLGQRLMTYCPVTNSHERWESRAGRYLPAAAEAV